MKVRFKDKQVIGQFASVLKWLSKLLEDDSIRLRFEPDKVCVRVNDQFKSMIVWLDFDHNAIFDNYSVAGVEECGILYLDEFASILPLFGSNTVMEFDKQSSNLCLTSETDGLHYTYRTADLSLIDTIGGTFDENAVNWWATGIPAQNDIGKVYHAISALKNDRVLIELKDADTVKFAIQDDTQQLEVFTVDIPMQGKLNKGSIALSSNILRHAIATTPVTIDLATTVARFQFYREPICQVTMFLCGKAD